MFHLWVLNKHTLLVWTFVCLGIMIFLLLYFQKMQQKSFSKVFIGGVFEFFWVMINYLGGKIWIVLISKRLVVTLLWLYSYRKIFYTTFCVGWSVWCEIFFFYKMASPVWSILNAELRNFYFFAWHTENSQQKSSFNNE